MSTKRQPRIEALRKRMHAESRGRRRIAIGKLEELGTPETVELLVAALRDPDEDVRGAAAVAVGRLGSTAAVSGLLDVVKRPGTYPRLCALDALVGIGSAVPAAALVPCVLDSEIGLRVSIVLDLLCRDWPLSPEARGLVPVAMEALARPHLPGLCEAVQFLGRTRVTEAVPQLQSCYHEVLSDLSRRLITTALALIADPALEPEPPSRPLKRSEIETWWGRLEQSGWLTEVPAEEAARIKAALANYSGDAARAYIALSPEWIDAELIENSGDYRRWVVSAYRGASFGAFAPTDIRDTVDIAKEISRVSFEVGGKRFSRGFLQEGDHVADGFHEFMNQVMAEVGARKRFYRLPTGDQTLAIVCVTPETLDRAQQLGLVPKI